MPKTNPTTQPPNYRQRLFRGPASHFQPVDDPTECPKRPEASCGLQTPNSALAPAKSVLDALFRPSAYTENVPPRTVRSFFRVRSFRPTAYAAFVPPGTCRAVPPGTVVSSLRVRKSLYRPGRWFLAVGQKIVLPGTNLLSNLAEVQWMQDFSSPTAANSQNSCGFSPRSTGRVHPQVQDPLGQSYRGAACAAGPLVETITKSTRRLDRLPSGVSLLAEG